jgi:hypothetical protein
VISSRKPSHVGGAIYGGIVMLATVGALSEDDAVGPGRMLFITITTVLVFWLAHAFSETIELHASADQTLPWRAAEPILRAEWSIVQAALPAVIGLGLAALGIFGRSAGVNLTLALGLAELFGWGLFTSRRAGRDFTHSVPTALLFTVLGVGIVLLKVAVAH